MEKILPVNHHRPLRVLIADRSAESEGSLSRLLAETHDIEVAGSARKAIEALALVEKLQPDALLLDIDMPGETLGFVLTLIGRNSRPPTVIILIPYASALLRQRALDAGADYVFSKTDDPENLLNTLAALSGPKRSRATCL